MEGEVTVSHGYRYLVCGIMVQTFFDLQTRARRGGRHFQTRQEALSFLESSWFETLCTSINLDPSYVKKEMLQGSVNKCKEA